MHQETMIATKEAPETGCVNTVIVHKELHWEEETVVPNQHVLCSYMETL